KKKTTYEMRKEARATAEVSARLSARPLCKRWRVHLPLSCDKTSAFSREVPFPRRGLADEILRVSSKPPAPREKPATIAANGTSKRDAQSTSWLEILHRWADDHLIDFHLDRLLDCVSDGSGDGAGRDGHFHELAQILSGRFVRTALRQFCSDRARGNHRAADIVGVQFQPQPFRHRAHGCLGGAVDRPAGGEHFDPENRSDVNDVTA